MKHLIIALVLLFNVFIPFNKSSANSVGIEYETTISNGILYVRLFNRNNFTVRCYVTTNTNIYYSYVLSARGYKDDVSRWYPLGYYDEYLSWNYSCN